MLYRVIWANVIVFIVVELVSLFCTGEGKMWLASSTDLEVLKSSLFAIQIVIEDRPLPIFQISSNGWILEIFVDKQ